MPSLDLMESNDFNADAVYAGKTGRTAKKLCAPCCWVIGNAPVRYCDAVAIPGDVYCAKHEPAQQTAASASSLKKFGFLFSAIVSRGHGASRRLA